METLGSRAPHPRPRPDGGGLTATAPAATLTGDGLRPVLVAAVVALVPLATGVVAWAAPGGDGDFNRRVTLAPFDLALAALALVEGRRALADRASGRTDGGGRRTAPGPRRGVLAWRGPATWLGVLGGALCLVLVAAFAVHPSWRGLELGLRVAAGAALVRATRLDDRAATALLATATATGALQAGLAVAQSVHGAPLGLASPWELDWPLYRFGSSHAGRGGLDHPYHLAVLLAVAVGAGLVGWARARRRMSRVAPLWLAGAAAAAGGLGVTYSRTVLLGLVASTVVVAVGAARQRRRGLLAAWGVVLAAVVTVALPLHAGWTARYATTAAGDVSRGRVTLARQALRVTADHPFTGVGPGRYTVALAAGGVADPLPVHDAVLLVGAEAGVFAAALALGLSVVVCRRWLRPAFAGGDGCPDTAVVGAAACCLVVPFFVLDVYPAVFPTGLALTAVWVAVLELARSGR